MNIQHLKYAVAVEKTGSISAAAETLYMSQPNLSKAVRELEWALGISIFKRTSKGAAVTAEGREFLRYAKNILAQFAEMEAIGRNKKHGVQSFRISVPRSSYIAEAFTSFVEELDLSKPIELDFIETNSMKAISHVGGGSSHLGIIRYKTEYEPYFKALLKEKSLEGQDIWEFEYRILMSVCHPLSRRDNINKRELDEYIEILHGDLSLPYHGEMAREPQRGETACDKKIYVYERGSQFDLLARVQNTYMWVSPMPSDLLERNGLVQKKCDAKDRFKDVLIYLEGHLPDEFETSFEVHLKKSIEKVSALR